LTLEADLAELGRGLRLIPDAVVAEIHSFAFAEDHRDADHYLRDNAGRHVVRVDPSRRTDSSVTASSGVNPPEAFQISS
jgi:hypothetical protein